MYGGRLRAADVEKMLRPRRSIERFGAPVRHR